MTKEEHREPMQGDRPVSKLLMPTSNQLFVEWRLITGFGRMYTVKVGEGLRTYSTLYCQS